MIHIKNLRNAKLYKLLVNIIKEFKKYASDNLKKIII